MKPIFRPGLFNVLLSVFALMLSICSCGLGTYHYWDSILDCELASGLISCDPGPYRIFAGEDIGNAIIDDGGTLWGVYVYYWPSCRPPREIEVRVDSVRILFDSLLGERTLERQHWRRSQDFHWTCVHLGPISLPKGQDPQFEVRFVMRVFDRSNNSLIDERYCQVKCNRYEPSY